MKFDAKSEDQIKREGLLEKGEYPFEVSIAEDDKSKSGNDMIALKLIVYTPDGKQRHVRDWILAAFPAKLRHFCDATGLLPQYQRGTLCAADCEGRSGRLRIGIEEDKDGKYPPKNNVVDYIVRPAKDLAAEKVAKASVPAEDNMPF